MFNIADIVNATCPDIAARPAWRSALLRLLKYEEIRDFAQGESHPNYPESSLPVFHRLYALREEKYEPKEIARRLREELAAADQEQAAADATEYPMTGHRTPEHQGTGGLIVLPQQALELLAMLVQHTADQAGDRLAQRLLPPPEDKVINAEVVAEMLSCDTVRSATGLLRRAGVKPVLQRPARWRRSDILRYIQQL